MVTLPASDKVPPVSVVTEAAVIAAENIVDPVELTVSADKA